MKRMQIALLANVLLATALVTAASARPSVCRPGDPGVMLLDAARQNTPAIANVRGAESEAARGRVDAKPVVLDFGLGKALFDRIAPILQKLDLVVIGWEHAE